MQLEHMIEHAEKHCDKEGKMTREEFFAFITEHEDEIADLDAEMAS